MTNDNTEYFGIRYYNELDDWCDFMFLVPTRWADIAASIVHRVAEKYDVFAYTPYDIRDYIMRGLDAAHIPCSDVSIMDFEDSCQWIDYLDYVACKCGVEDIVVGVMT